MKLGTKGRYAVMAMVDLALHDYKDESRESAISLSDISERTEISLPYLEQIFMKLRKKGLVTSLRGPGGGYHLAKPALDIPIMDILQAVEEGVEAVRCDRESPIGCRQDKGKCLTHDLWKKLDDHMNAFLSQTNLEDVLKNQNLVHSKKDTKTRRMA